MFTSSKEYLNLYFENEKKAQKISKLNESAYNENVKNLDEESQNIYEQHLNNKMKFAKASKIKNEVKKSLLSECIYNVCSKSLGSTITHETEFMTKSFIKEFIEENGVDKLLLGFKTKSYMLSEFSRIINKYTDIICEKSNYENPDNFSISAEDKSNFYDELDMEDIEDASQIIKTRVAASIDSFLSDNLNSKAEIKEIIQQSQEKISGTKNEELKEFYEIQAKKRMTAIRESKPKSIFETMVFRIAKSCVVNEDMKNVYMKDNKLDMDSIVETVEVMYTFLETLNTCKIVDVDEKYINSVLEQLQ